MARYCKTLPFSDITEVCYSYTHCISVRIETLPQVLGMWKVHNPRLSIRSCNHLTVALFQNDCLAPGQCCMLRGELILHRSSVLQFEGQVPSLNGQPSSRAEIECTEACMVIASQLWCSCPVPTQMDAEHCPIEILQEIDLSICFPRKCSMTPTIL